MHVRSAFRQAAEKDRLASLCSSPAEGVDKVRQLLITSHLSLITLIVTAVSGEGEELGEALELE